VFWSHNVITLAALFTTKPSQSHLLNQKRPPLFKQWMMKEERTKAACEEIESLFLRIETA
jgi:hypothetical protein